jgi:hypothetical protein
VKRAETSGKLRALEVRLVREVKALNLISFFRRRVHEGKPKARGEFGRKLTEIRTMALAVTA